MSDLFDPFGPPKEKAPPRVEQVLVAVSENGESFVLTGRGGAIESDLDAGMSRLDEAGPLRTDAAPGLWVWEGIPGWAGNSDDGYEPDYDGTFRGKPRGEWRRPTPEEWAKIQAGDLDLFGPPHINREPLFLGPDAPEAKP